MRAYVVKINLPNNISLFLQKDGTYSRNTGYWFTSYSSATKAINMLPAGFNCTVKTVYSFSS